jgi:type I restriction enzyme S subunit
VSETAEPLAAREPSAKYVALADPALVRGFELLTTVPDGVSRLRELILSLAVRGRLVDRQGCDEPASGLLKRVGKQKEELVAVGKLKREQPARPIPRKECPFDIPAGWVWTRLGQAALKITDGTHHSPANGAQGAFKYISAKNIRSWGLDLSTVTYVDSAVHDEIYSRCDPELGDVLYVKDGATTGVLTINTLAEPFSMLSSVALLKPSVALVAKYLALVMAAPFFYDEMRAGMTGVAITRVTLGKLNDAVVPLPPLAEQHRIVARVEELMKLCDALEQSGRLAAEQHARLTSTLFDTLAASESAHALAESWQRVAEHFDLLLDRPEEIDALEATIIQLGVRGKLTAQNPANSVAKELLVQFTARKRTGTRGLHLEVEEIDAEQRPPLPRGWVWARLEDISTAIVDCPHSTPKFVDTGLLCVDTNSFKGGRLLPHKLRYVTEQSFEDRVARLRPQPGDLVFAREGSVGESLIIPPGVVACLGQRVMLFRFSNLVFNEFVRMVITSTDFLSMLLGMHKGIGAKHVNVGDMRRAVIPLPPLPEQIRIVALVQELLLLCGELRDRLIAGQATHSRLADALVAEVA